MRGFQVESAAVKEDLEDKVDCLKAPSEVIGNDLVEVGVIGEMGVELNSSV
jgi:hypothetical protein